MELSRRYALCRLAFFACLLAGLTGLAGATPTADADPLEGGDRLIVRYLPGTDGPDRAEARKDAGVVPERNLQLARTQVVVTEPGIPVTEALDDLSADPAVAYAEPDGSYQLSVPEPDDEHFEAQWALANTGQTYTLDGVTASGTPGSDVGALDGWNLQASSDDVPTAVIDTGVFAAHPDLANQVFRNPDEIPGNGIDDDGNGLVDDVSGWDFVAGHGLPEDSDGHGTHVAGIIGATGGNGIGISGVSPDASIMPLRACTTESCQWSDVADAIAYAGRMGAKVANLSFGAASGTSRSNYEAIKAASDTLFVISAGNEGTDNDQTRQFPCMIDQAQKSDFPEWEMEGNTLEPLDNVICVAASNHRDLKPSISNYGASSVDLAAPGWMILSTLPYHQDASGYGFMTGTSMAAPQVSGIAALARSLAPELTPAQTKQAILSGTDPLTGWQPYPTVSGGRASLSGTLTQVTTGTLPDPDPDPADPDPDPDVTDRQPGRIKLVKLFPRLRPAAMAATLNVTQPGRIRVRATAKFRWSPRVRAKRRVIVRSVIRRTRAGRFTVRLRLTRAGLRLKRVAPRRKVAIRFSFAPRDGRRNSTVKRSFRFKPPRR